MYQINYMIGKRFGLDYYAEVDELQTNLLNSVGEKYKTWNWWYANNKTLVINFVLERDYIWFVMKYAGTGVLRS